MRKSSTFTLSSLLDEELVVKTAKKTGRVFTVEEHSIIGGLGAAVAETLGEKCPTKITRIGVNDVFGDPVRQKNFFTNTDWMQRESQTASCVSEVERRSTGGN